MDNLTRRLKVTNRTLRRKVSTLKAFLALNVIIAVSLLVTLIIVSSSLITTKYKNSVLEEKLAQTEDINRVLADSSKEKDDTIEKITKVAAELDSQNKELVTTLDTQNEELESLREREELYDKFEYALVREDGSRTDITYENIKSLYELAKEYDLGSDAVKVVLAISMNESQGYKDVKSSQSTASGLAGLTAATAKYSYETLLGNGANTYKKAYVFDGEKNLQMSLAYIAYLKDTTNGSTVSILNGYRGLYDPGYINKISEYLGKNINDIDL